MERGDRGVGEERNKGYWDILEGRRRMGGRLERERKVEKRGGEEV